MILGNYILANFFQCFSLINHTLRKRGLIWQKTKLKTEFR